MRGFQPLQAHETLVSREKESRRPLLKEEDKRFLKGQVLEILPGFGVILTAWVVMWLTGRPAFVISLAVLFGVGVDAWRVWRGALERDPLRLLRNAGASFAALWVISLLNAWLGGWGLLGVVLLSGLLAGWVLYTRRAAYMAAIRHIEKRFFGMTMEERREMKRGGK